MKVYASPVSEPQIDYQNFKHADYDKANSDYEAANRKWLTDNGYNGKHSGRIVSFGVADGAARYMLADGKKSFLIHLAEGDSYQYRDVEFLPKKEIIKRLEQGAAVARIFGRTAE